MNTPCWRLRLPESHACVGCTCARAVLAGHCWRPRRLVWPTAVWCEFCLRYTGCPISGGVVRPL